MEEPVYDEDDYYYYEDEDYASSCEKGELQTKVSVNSYPLIYHTRVEERTFLSLVK